MANAQFKIGDNVQLKSGGPSMTVNRLTAHRDESPAVECVWFDSTAQGGWGEPHTHIFAVESLQLAPLATD